MIRDLSKTIEKLLTRQGLPLPLSSAQISFDRPTETFQPQQTTVNLFLYDVREDVQRRSNESILERRNGTALVRRPPARVACSYLVTAWPFGGTEPALQEHRLLGQVLQEFLKYPMIPAQLLQGGLAGQEPALPVVAAQGDGLKGTADFWTALGTRMRASFTVTVTISLALFEPEQLYTVRASDLAFTDPEGTLPKGHVYRIGGRVLDAAGAPLPGATLTIVGLGLEARADAEGRYTLGPVGAGSYTLRAEHAGAQRDVTGVPVPPVAGTTYDVQFP